MQTKGPPSLPCRSVGPIGHSGVAGSGQSQRPRCDSVERSHCAGRVSRRADYGHTIGRPSLFVPSCLRRHMTSCSRRSSPFKISSVVGCFFLFCCSAEGILHHSGNASATFSGFLLPTCTGIWPVCHCVLIAR